MNMSCILKDKVACRTINSFVLGTGTRELKAAEICKPKGGQFCRNPKSLQEALSCTCPTFWPGTPEHILVDAIFCSQLMLYFKDTNSYNKVKTTLWKVRSDPDAFRSLSQQLASPHIEWRQRGTSEDLQGEAYSKILHFPFSTDWTEAFWEHPFCLS